MRVRYDAHLPALSLTDGENSRTILAERVLPTVQGHNICKNWHLCGLCWEDCKSKNLHVPTSPYVAANLTGLSKTAWGE